MTEGSQFEIGHRGTAAVIEVLGDLDINNAAQFEAALELARRSIVVDTTMKTSRDRVYAAGDVTDYPGKVKLIATGFGEAATAINNIAVELDPNAHLFPGHSSG